MHITMFWIFFFLWKCQRHQQKNRDIKIELDSFGVFAEFFSSLLLVRSIIFDAEINPNHTIVSVRFQFQRKTHQNGFLDDELFDLC